MPSLPRLRPLLAAALVLGVMATACAAADTMPAAAPEGEPAVLPAAAPERAPGELRVVLPELAESWDPALATTPAAHQQILHVMEPLIRLDPDGTTFRPGLAESWSYDEEDLSFEIDLEEDARFSTGERVTSEDVAFSVADWQAGTIFGDRYDVIASIEIIDDRTLVLELSRPAPELELHLSQAAAAIVPANYAGRTRGDFFEHPVGAGPYRISSETPGSELTLATNPVSHRLGDLTFDTIVVTAEPDDAARLAAYRSGAADIVTIRSWDIPELPADQVVRAAPHRLTFVGLNRQRPIADPEVQDALAAVLDYPAMADQAEGTMAIPYGADGAVRDAVTVGSAPALEQAELIFDATDREHRRLAESLRAAIAGLGHAVQVTGLDPDEFDTRRHDGDYDLILVRTDALQAQDDLADDAEFLPLVAHRAPFVRQPSIGGFDPLAIGTWWFDDLTLIEPADDEPEAETVER